MGLPQQSWQEPDYILYSVHWLSAIWPSQQHQAGIHHGCLWRILQLTRVQNNTTRHTASGSLEIFLLSSAVLCMEMSGTKNKMWVLSMLYQCAIVWLFGLDAWLVSMQNADLLICIDKMIGLIVHSICKSYTTALYFDNSVFYFSNAAAIATSDMW